MERGDGQGGSKTSGNRGISGTGDSHCEENSEKLGSVGGLGPTRHRRGLWSYSCKFETVTEEDLSALEEFEEPPFTVGDHAEKFNDGGDWSERSFDKLNEIFDELEPKLMKSGEEEVDVVSIDLTPCSYAVPKPSEASETGGSSLEKLLGIVPEDVANPHESSTCVLKEPKPLSPSKESDENCSKDSHKIVVKEVIPNSCSESKIKVGDIIQLLNGKTVSAENVENILLEIINERRASSSKNLSPKVTMSVKRPLAKTVGTKSSTREHHQNKVKYNVQSKGNQRVEKNLLSPRVPKPDLPIEISSNIAVIFINNDSSPQDAGNAGAHDTQGEHDISIIIQGAAGNQDVKSITFSWPKKEERISRKAKALASSHGMFTALYNLLYDITNSFPILKEFAREGLLLVHRLMERVKNTLLFRYGSLSRAFSNSNETDIDDLLGNLFSGLIDISEEFLFMEVPAVYFHIPLGIRSTIDDLLYSFESCDYKVSYYAKQSGLSRPNYHCLGSCLLYKGAVVVSHMDKDHAMLYHSWWKTRLNLWNKKRNTLTYTWRWFRRLALWQQCFLPDGDPYSEWTSLESNAGTKCNLVPSYALLVGFGNYMIGCLLQCVDPTQRVKNPDMFWLQRALTTLVSIADGERGESIENWIQKLPPDFIDLYPSSSTVGSTGKNPSHRSKSIWRKKVAADEQGTSKSLISRSINPYVGNNPYELPRTSTKPLGNDPAYEPSNFMREGNEEIGSGLCDDGGWDSDEDVTTTTGSDTSSVHGQPKAPELTPDGPPEGFFKSIQLGKSRTIFDFMQLDYGRGIFLSSRDIREGPYAVILHNFKQSVAVIHSILHKAAHALKNLSSSDPQDRAWISEHMAPISEHGILFRTDVKIPKSKRKKQKVKKIDYWVIGRIYPSQREIYVCHRDKHMPDITEMAFKIALAAPP